MDWVYIAKKDNDIQILESIKGQKQIQRPKYP